MGDALLMTRTRIDLGSIQCNTGTAVDGVLWSCGWPEGWDSPSQRGGTLDPTGRDGSAGLASFWSGRELVIPGRCIATTEANAWAAFDLVISSLPGIRGEMDLVVHETTPKGLTVVQHGQPRADPVGINMSRTFLWQITVRADRPLKEAVTAKTDTVAAGATEAFVNDGTAAAYPVIAVTSAGTVDLVIGGRHFTTTSLAVGAYIDMWARTIKDSGGVDITPWPKLAATEWLAFPPGSTSVQQAGTAALSITHHDTYA